MADRFVPLSSLQTSTSGGGGNRFVALGGGNPSTNGSVGATIGTSPSSGGGGFNIGALGGLFRPAAQGASLLDLGGPVVNSLQGLGGLAGLAGGIQSGNPWQASAGGLQTASSAANLAGYGGLGAGIGMIGGPLGIASAIANQNYTGLPGSVLSTLNSANTLSGWLGGPSVNLTQIGADALQTAFPSLANALGIGTTTGGVSSAGVFGGAGGAASAGATAPELASLGATGAEIGGTAAGGAGAAGLGAASAALAAYAPVIAAIAWGVMNNEQQNMDSLYKKAKEAVNMRQALPEAIQQIQGAIQQANPATVAGMSNDQLLAYNRQLQTALTERRSLLSKVEQSKGSEAPSMVPRIDVGGIQNLMGLTDQRLIPASAAVQDELARRGVGLEQFFTPGGQTDFLGLAGYHNPALANVTPQQLASIGPGNMVAALQALQAGGSLPLAGAITGVGTARQNAFSTLGPDQWGTYAQWAPYLFTPQQRQQIDQARASDQVGLSTGGPTNQGNLLLTQFLGHGSVMPPPSVSDPYNSLNGANYGG